MYTRTPATNCRGYDIKRYSIFPISDITSSSILLSLV